MKKAVLDYLCKCEGWKTAIKQLHWNADNMSQHKLCDDIADRISEFQDQVGEVEQSISGNLPFNKLKGTEYKVVNLKKFVEDVIDGTDAFLKKVEGMGREYIGMRSDCESFLSDMQRNLYLTDFTMKEDFKGNYKKMINGKKQVRLTESELDGVITEAVKRVVSRMVNEGCNEVEVQGGEYEDNELDYTHFAVNKTTGLIVDGWGYAGYDKEELKQFKNDYFYNDLRDNGFNPKAYKILSFKACQKAGMNPNDKTKWSMTGVFPLNQEKEMIQNGEKPYDIAYEEHPDWFV